jgi:hypothetical protein
MTNPPGRPPSQEGPKVKVALVTTRRRSSGPTPRSRGGEPIVRRPEWGASTAVSRYRRPDAGCRPVAADSRLLGRSGRRLSRRGGELPAGFLRRRSLRRDRPALLRARELHGCRQRVCRRPVRGLRRIRPDVLPGPGVRGARHELRLGPLLSLRGARAELLRRPVRAGRLLQRRSLCGGRRELRGRRDVRGGDVRSVREARSGLLPRCPPAGLRGRRRGLRSRERDLRLAVRRRRSALLPRRALRGWAHLSLHRGERRRAGDAGLPGLRRAGSAVLRSGAGGRGVRRRRLLRRQPLRGGRRHLRDRAGRRRHLHGGPLPGVR